MTDGQPRLGLLGLVLVVPIATLLALGAGGAERSALVLGPLVTYAVPLVAMTHVSLNALGASVILHVAIGRRWPFGQATRSASTSAARASRSSAAT